MKVLIAGQAKSGTTALYFALKQSLPAYYQGLFEPSHLETSNQDVVAKIIIGDSMPVNLQEFEGFDRKILIVRDPRDNLVSRLLYLPFDLPWYNDDEKIGAYCELLSQKQHQPASVSILALLERLAEYSHDDLIGHTIRHHQYGFSFAALEAGYFVVKYEDFIANRLEALESYLGFPIRFDGEVGKDFAHIARKKGQGDWRNWFTRADIDFFGPIYAGFIIKYEYERAWDLNTPQQIEFVSSVDYVRRLIQERRAIEAQALLDKILGERDKGLAYLQNEVAQLEAQLKSMSESKFWKLRNYYQILRGQPAVAKPLAKDKVS
jgi:hypothetical protein